MGHNDNKDKHIRAAVEALKAGHLVGLPTETVYGLGADATNPMAIAAIFEAKGRPRFNPLISHVYDLGAAQRQGTFSPLAVELAHAFWPGPLTLVVPRHEGTSVCELACAGLDTIALRVPNHELTRALLSNFGKPIAAPSANISGRPSPTLAVHVTQELGDKVAMVLDGGACQIGLESAVVAVSGDQATLLRLGGLSRQDIESIAGSLLSPNVSDVSAPPSPGMLLRHYAPKAKVILNQTDASVGGIFLGFGLEAQESRFNLSPSGDLQEAAANLFAMLRAADELKPVSIAIASIPSHGLGEAINDRLTRAARG
jgi:L-threonylcarbamoyladenylate synthase